MFLTGLSAERHGSSRYSTGMGALYHTSVWCPGHHLQPPRKVKDRGGGGQPDPGGDGHRVELDGGGRRLERPGGMMDVRAVETPARGRRVEAVALDQEVLETAGRRLDGGTHGRVAGAELGRRPATVASPAGVADAVSLRGRRQAGVVVRQ